MKNKKFATSVDSFSGFASLYRYFELIKTSKPTLQQAEQAVELLCRTYGAKNEEDLRQRADAEIISIFNEMKAKIMEPALAN
jgi:hypothetical protein